MEFQIPTDLTQRLQLSLRTQAGLPTYDPSDPTLPSLPSLRQSVVALSHPSDHLCCHCAGSLLRGPHSAFCVYCGASQPTDPPQPLAFKSTVAYGWLLQSLGLDGSEIVEPSIDEHTPNRGHSTPKDKLPLSDLLNLEIPWLAGPDITERSLSKNASAQRKSMTNMGGVDLDNLFTYAKDLVSDLREEQAVRNKHTENLKSNALAGQEKIVLSPEFRNPVMAAVTFSEAKEDFSCWEADFQSADSGGQREPSKSSDRLVSSTDLSTHMDSVFGSGEHFENIEAKDVSTPSVSTTSDWTQGDLWNNSTHVAEQVETATEVKDRINADSITPSSSDWFPDNQWQTHSNVATENKPTCRDDDSFDVWNDYTSSSGAHDPSKRSFGSRQVKPTMGNDDSSDVWDDFTSFSNSQDPFKSSFAVTEIKASNGPDDSPDVWDGSISSSNVHVSSKSSFAATEIKATTVDDDSSVVWDGYINSANARDPFKSSATVTDNKLTTRDDDSSDVWDGFTSSSNAHHSFKNSITVTGDKPTTGVDDPSDVWDGFTGSSNAHDPFKSSTTIDNKPTTEVDDSSDVWDGFASASNAHDPFKSSIITTDSELTTGVDDSSDAWDEFTSSSNAHEFQSSVTASDNKPVTGVDYSSDVWDFTSSSIAHDPFKGSITSFNNKPTNTRDDSYDFWDAFTSSSNVQNPSNSANTHSITAIAAVGEQTIDNKFASSYVNFQETDFGSFSQSDVSFGLVSDKNVLVEVTERQSEVSSSKRMAGEEVEAGDARIASKGGDGLNSAAKSEDAMEILFSQMHDLSFMLKTELSVPSINDNSSPSQDLRPGS